ncbi:MAG TPA: hypothetical protein PJ982_03050 [Lacipirellulaceae bacterium]|nr:hypothetical protein [Lacipirellulaceae bacterium]
MVIVLIPTSVATMLLVTEQAAEPLIERLDPERRVAVVMALLGIAIVGVFLVTMILLGGSWVRRLARYGRGPTKDTTNVANKRLRDALAPMLPEDGRTDETTVVDRGTDETVTDRE